MHFEVRSSLCWVVSLFRVVMATWAPHLARVSLSGLKRLPTAVAFASYLFVDRETCSEVIMPSVRVWERRGKGGSLSTGYTWGWTFWKLSLCEAPRGLVMGPSFLQHLDFQAISSSLRFFSGSALWGMHSPLACVFCTFSAQRGRTTSSSFRIWSSAVVSLPALAVGGVLGVYI